MGILSGGFTAIIFITVFVTVLGLFLNNMGLASFTAISPIAFSIGQALLIAVIGLSNTPIAKGVSLALWSSWIFVYLFSLNIPNPLGNIIYGVILVPAFIVSGMVFLEVGKG